MEGVEKGKQGQQGGGDSNRNGVYRKATKCKRGRKEKEKTKYQSAGVEKNKGKGKGERGRGKVRRPGLKNYQQKKRWKQK